MNIEKIVDTIFDKTKQTLLVIGGSLVVLLLSSYISTGQMVSNKVFDILNSPSLFAGILGYLITGILIEFFWGEHSIFRF